MKYRQRGVTFIGLVVIGIIIACIGVVAAQVVPTVVEYQSISKAATRAAEGSTVAEVRAIFDRAAAIDNIKSIAGRDLIIGKENDRVIVEFEYEREIPLFGPAYLLMRYSGSSRTPSR